MQNKKANVYAFVTSAPTAFILLILVLTFFGIYFFVLGGANAPDRALKAEGFSMNTELYSLLQTTHGQSTFAQHIVTRNQFVDELNPLMAEMLQKSDYIFIALKRLQSGEYTEVQTAQEDLFRNLITEDLLFLRRQGESRTTNKQPLRAILPTEDPKVAILVQLCDVSGECIG